MKILPVVFVAATLFFYADAGAQIGEMKPTPRFSVGVTGGVFRTSLEDFNALYGTRYSFGGGMHVSYRIKNQYNLLVKYRQIRNSTDFLRYDEIFHLTWRQSWLNIGVRYLPQKRGKFSPIFSFGVALFEIVEEGGLSIFQGAVIDPAPQTTRGSGFFLDLGMHYSFSEKMALIFETEITSGGAGAASGIGGQSIGGFLFNGGLAVFF